MSRCRAVVLLTLVLAWPAALRAEDKAAAEDRESTVVYDVSHLFARPGHSGVRRIEEVVKTIVASVHPGGWGEQEGAGRIRELNGTRLEIRTTARYHKEVAELLETLRRMNDVAVNLRAELYEIDRAVWEKEIAPKLKRRHAAEMEDDAAAVVLRKKGTRATSRQMPAAVGEEVQLVSVRQAFAFIENATLEGKRQVNEYGAGFEGLSVRLTPTVSADRRFVHLKIAQHATELVEIKKQRKLVANDPIGWVTVEVPQRVETTTTVTAEVADGSWALAAVPYRSPAMKRKDRVLVLAVWPEIHIEEEDRARGGNNPK